MIKNIAVLLALILFMAACKESKVEVPQESKELFDFGWKFYLGDNLDASTVEFNDDDWRGLDLPHDWSIEGKIAVDNPMGVAGGYFPSGIGWYRKSFNVPAEWKNKCVSIYFEGVYMNSEVFINGKSLGVWPYGYTSFFYDLTPYLKYDDTNIIAVKVDNSQQVNSRWYSGSGIYRHVWLQATDSVHIKNWGVAITTTDVSKKEATVQIKTIIQNKTKNLEQVTLALQILDDNSTCIESSDFEAEIKANSEKEITRKIIVKNPSLWSPENPNLYKASIIIKREDNVLDAKNEAFGIRSIKYSVENGFELNGKMVLLNGGCVHHDNGCLGAKAYDRAEERRVELLKEAGFNSVRTSHNPPSEAFLDACDRLGLLVIDESFDGWKVAKTPRDYANYFDEWWQRDLEAMVLRDRNHPSIIMWSTGNEILERTSPEAVKTAQMLTHAVHQIDTTRPVTSALTTWDQGWEIFDPLFAAHDIGGYNYQLLPYAESDHERVPSRIMVQTESYPKNAFKVWDMVSKHNYIIGDYVWTALDYLGESSIGRYYYPGEPEGEHWQNEFFPNHGAYCGDINLIGVRKAISHYRDMLYNNNEKLYMAVREPNPKNGEIKLTMWSVWPTWESWTWPGYEGEDIQVEVYSKYPKVRLYLNDKLIDELPTTIEQEYKAVFAVPYAEGELKAAAVDKDNKEVESKILNTAGKASNIVVNVDRSEIAAGGQDLAFVIVDITDDKGVLQLNAENQLKFKVEGPAEIIAVDNANLKDADLYVSDTRKAWKGQALVVIKSTKIPGNIKLTVYADGLPEAGVNIKSVKK